MATKKDLGFAPGADVHIFSNDSAVGEGRIAGTPSGASGEVIRRMLHDTQFRPRVDTDLFVSRVLPLLPGAGTRLIPTRMFVLVWTTRQRLLVPFTRTRSTFGTRAGCVWWRCVVYSRTLQPSQSHPLPTRWCQPWSTMSCRSWTTIWGSVQLQPFHLANFTFCKIITALNQINQVKHPFRVIDPRMSVP